MLRLAEIVITYVLLLITWEDLQLRFVKNFDQLSQKFLRKNFGNLNCVLNSEKFVNFCICLSASFP